jgi:hypothetical protein
MSTRYIGGPISLHSKPPSSSTYVCSHFSTILGHDTPCTKHRWPGFIDDGQGQALDPTCVYDLLHGVHEVGREDLMAPIDKKRWSGLKARSHTYQLLSR